MPVATPKYRPGKSKLNQILKELEDAKGVNGVRFLIRKYFSRSFRHALVLKSPEFFMLYYLGFRLPKHQRHWWFLWLTVKYLLELAPRDHGKSWVFSYGGPLYDIYTSLIRTNLLSVEARILEISKTDQQSLKYADQVRSTIENNRWLNEDFGDIRGKHWLKGTFTCRKDLRDSVEKDFTYEQVGALGAITGGHFSRIVGDDILDDENTKNIERMDNMENWFWGTIWNLREPVTKIDLAGTLKHRRDLYHTIMKNPTWITNKEKAVIKFPMIPDPDREGQEKQGWLFKTNQGRHVSHPNELRLEEKIIDVELLTDDYEVLWPSSQAVDNDGNLIWDDDPKSGEKRPVVFGWGIKELLLDRATQGDSFFYREKMNEITGESGLIFDRKWFTYFNTDQIVFNPTDGYFYLAGEKV